MCHEAKDYDLLVCLEVLLDVLVPCERLDCLVLLSELALPVEYVSSGSSDLFLV